MRASISIRTVACALLAAAALACSSDSSGDDEGDGDGGDGETGAVCGGLAGSACADTHFCDYPDGANCGTADGAGSCQPRPSVCVPIVQEVCGCDGERYNSACDAQRMGVDVSTDTSC